MKTKSLSLHVRYSILAGVFCLTLIFLTVSSISAAIRPGFNSNSMPANDEDVVNAVPLGFSINFFEMTYSSVNVKNNGNVTFSSTSGSDSSTSLGNVFFEPIIAPFGADVDTRGSGSGIVRYGTGTVNNRSAFGVNWINVGYFSQHFDKLNSFQLIIIDRSDRATGAFDVEFNYDSITWETGDWDGGNGGLGGFSAIAGFSDGSANDFELPGSRINSGLLNSNSTTGLINNSRNSTILGRYVFEFPLQARVTKVAYEQINGGTSPINNNSNAGGGRRIFPDKDTPTDGIDRRKIRVKA